ncbi:zinc-binding protein A33-like [Protobothrops mucrosquamatus]|uniref:zinc-binding protein A33-like n=1 Tax=Protobothrops mucrosquamatus TaxID=103944 RepID=UPI0010FBBC28|nr:zinc-binding protein A33-like [Protobothrops mucrosquamatus]
MASVREVSSFTEDLLCPICLSLFRDPRMLTCGHSFCAPCLEPCIPMGLCPECRHPFALRDMTINRALCSLSEKARLLRMDEGYFCEEHKEPLKLFCSQDEEPICVICRDLPEHRGHDFLPTKNAVQTYQDQLKAFLEPLEEDLRRLKRSQCHQQENIIELKTCSESLSDHVSGEFVKMHQLLNDRELGIKQALENQREKNLAQMETKLKELDWKMASCSETLCCIQAGLECKDHISFLKEAKELLERVSKEQPDEPELGAKLVGEDGLGASNDDTSNDDTDEFVNEVDRLMRDAEDDDEEEEEEGEQEEEPETAAGEEEKEEDEDGVVAVDLNVGEFKGPLQFCAWKQLLGAVHPVPASLTLDYNLACPSLVQLKEATGVTFSPNQCFSRQKSKCFTSSLCVMGWKGITTGCFYWEIEVGDSTGWVVGMAKKSVKRKKRLNVLPKEGVWAIELKAGEYQALSEPCTPLLVCGRMEKVGVYLDFEGGHLYFYNGNSMTHLYTFQECFHEELLPFLSTQSSYPLSVWNLVL